MLYSRTTVAHQKGTVCGKCTITIGLPARSCSRSKRTSFSRTRAARWAAALAQVSAASPPAGTPATVCLFVCGISLTSGQLVSELFPDCTRSCFSQVVLRRRGGDCIYEMRCLFVAVGPNARFIVLPHWDNMSQAHMLTLQSHYTDTGPNRDLRPYALTSQRSCMQTLLPSKGLLARSCSRCMRTSFLRTPAPR